MSKLRGMVGQQICLHSPSLNEKPTTAKLVNVDEGGIWVEYPPFLEDMLASVKRTQSPKTVVLFVPYERVYWIVGTEEYPYISEKIVE